MEPAKTYDPRSVEKEVYDAWNAVGAFNADPSDPRRAFCIVIPPPNVTAALHLGHALNNTLQDVIIRWRRMQQFNTLWMPGTDHAGIATQTVVEKRILAEEGRRRTDFARDDFIARIQAWKDEYEARIINQLKLMGCSCDWRRTRFTMDDVCAAAVRATFFKLFADGLIYRGKRLVNWDVATQTVLADDEVEYEQVQGNFWYLRYPLTEPVVVRNTGEEHGTGGAGDMGVASDRSTGGAGDMGVASDRSTGILPVCPTGILPVDPSETQRRYGARLPHWTREGATYAVTFRLADSLPSHIVEGYKREREEIVRRAADQGRKLTYIERRELDRLYSARIDSQLCVGQGSCSLKEPRVAEMVQEALLHFDGQRYEIIAWCIMPNHVHAILQPLPGHELDRILHSWKSFTAKEANRLIGATGQFWQEEYYDHLIRDEEDLHESIMYVLSNPQKANLKDWPWCGLKKSTEEATEEAHGQDARATEEETIRWVTVATTRPETMLGDTAVAMNPADPRAKYLVGKMVRLPIVGREIPIIADDHVVLPNPESDDEKARFSTGFLKVTPAHDPDDYQIGQRHNLEMINVMAPDGTISDRHGWSDWDQIKNPDVENLIGLDRFEAREAVVEFFRKENLLEDVRPYTHQVGHSYRSHVPIEPYLSDQWYVAVKKQISDSGIRISDWVAANGELVETRDGVTYLKATDVPVNSLAGLALAPLMDGRVKFIPQRYSNNYRTWLENLRDWPISRQLWWGHRIPVWSKPGHHDVSLPANVALVRHAATDDGDITYVCIAGANEATEQQLEQQGFARDSDVLDTWFSSALWPFSTLGWPKDTPEVRKYYPGDVLCTAREIITLWVSRMVMMGQYCVGDIPFSDVFIHAMIQDGEGRKMSKSLGNGIDPLDIIDSHGADAMRFTLVSMTTQTQDVRMPVEAMTLPDGRKLNSSPKFDVGRNFCNKLWNASRFAMMNLRGMSSWADVHQHRNLADTWIIGRLNETIRDAANALDGYRFNELADRLYHFMWDDFCDWYLEIAKSRINAGENAPKAVVAHCLDVMLRMLHPIIPFITEAIWQRLNEVAPVRGPGDEPAEAMLVTAQWPQADAAAIHPSSLRDFATLQDIIRQVRNARTEHNVPPAKAVEAIAEAGDGPSAELLRQNVDLLRSQANLAEVRIVGAGEAPADQLGEAASVSAGGIRLYVQGIIDKAAEIARLGKKAEPLRRGIAGIQGKLSNQGFIAKAPPDVVSRERERLAELSAELDAIEQSLAKLQQ